MNIERQYAFVDEFGIPNLDLSNQNVSSHFIVTAIIIGESKISELEGLLEPIRKRHFQTGEMKSSKVGSNDHRRKQILSELSNLEFNIYALIIDKSKVVSEGLQWKRSFFKFINGLLYRPLYHSYPNLKLIADRIGDKEYMQSFKAYIEKKHIPDLFNQAEFGFVSKSSKLLVQLADFITGTLARCFDRTVFSTAGRDFVQTLKPRIISLEEWPREFKTLIESPKLKTDCKVNQIIAMRATNSVEVFIQENEKSDDPTILNRIKCAKFLLLNCLWIDANKYVSTESIIRNLHPNQLSSNKYRRYIRSAIIAKLRDAGVLIASSSKGYKIPVNEDDLSDFAEHTSAIILPMVQRIAKCRKAVLLATKNKCDILNYHQFDYLKPLASSGIMDKLLAEEHPYTSMPANPEY